MPSTDAFVQMLDLTRCIQSDCCQVRPGMDALVGLKPEVKHGLHATKRSSGLCSGKVLQQVIALLLPQQDFACLGYLLQGWAPLLHALQSAAGAEQADTSSALTLGSGSEGIHTCPAKR